MFRTLRGRLVVAFVALAVGGIGLANLLIHMTVERQFEQYIRANMQDRAQRIARSLEGVYSPEGWTQDFFVEITYWSLMEGLNITLESPSNNQIWSSSDASAEMLLPLQHPHPVPTTLGISIQEPIVVAERQVAKLRVTSGPQGLYSEHDLHFRGGLYRALRLSALAAGLVAICAAWVMSRGIHRPLLEMTRVAEKLRMGDWQQRVPRTGTAELQQLGDSMNHLTVSLQYHEQMRKRMTRDVAHELRTPLAVLRSHLEAIQDAIWLPTPDRIGLCHSEVMRLVRLVDDLNQLAEAESEARSLECDDMPLQSLLEPLVTGYAPLFADKQVAFRFEPPPGDVWVNVDRDKASQVVINLLANAQKYTPEGGEVRLEATADDLEAFVTVSDTGPGIPPQEIPTIFERFYRGDPSRTRATGGAGLGLAIAKTLAESHHGRIEVHCAPGQGATFMFVLPRVRARSVMK